MPHILNNIYKLTIRFGCDQTFDNFISAFQLIHLQQNFSCTCIYIEYMSQLIRYCIVNIKGNCCLQGNYKHDGFQVMKLCHLCGKKWFIDSNTSWVTAMLCLFQRLRHTCFNRRNNNYVIFPSNLTSLTHDRICTKMINVGSSSSVSKGYSSSFLSLSIFISAFYVYMSVLI